MNPALWLFAICGATFLGLSIIVGVFMDLEDRRLYRAAGYTTTSRTRVRVTEDQAPMPQPDPIEEDGVPYWHALVISSLSLSLRGEFQDSPQYSKDARMSASNSKTELQGSVPSTSRRGLQGPLPK